MKRKPIVYFFRSLNTAGGDLIQIGPVRLGHFWSKFSEVLDDEILDFRPVTNIGGGSLFDQAERALDFILKDLGVLGGGDIAATGGVSNEQRLVAEDYSAPDHLPSLIPRDESIQTDLSISDLQDDSTSAAGFSKHKVHFFGHSAGGLVMKLVAQDPRLRGRIRSMISIGTPHHGTSVARWASEMDIHNPRLAVFLKMLRYNVLAKRETFKSFDDVALMDFQFDPEIFTGSVLCAPPRSKWSRTYRWIHKWLPPEAIPEPCDGLIELDSQRFGDVSWNFELDHIQQMGFGGQRVEFLRLCRFLSELWLDLDHQSRDVANHGDSGLDLAGGSDIGAKSGCDSNS